MGAPGHSTAVEGPGRAPVGTRSAQAEIKTPLTHSDAVELAMHAVVKGEDSAPRLVAAIAQALMAVDVASRSQAEEPLIFAIAYLGMRADEEGDIHAREVAADAIAVARGIKPAQPQEPDAVVASRLIEREARQ